MFGCGVAYPRCRWIMPLILVFAMIFQLIAICAKSGWVEDENAKTHYASMWQNCRGRNDHWLCSSLMESSWAQAVAALMIISLIILILAFFISCAALCCSFNLALMPVIVSLLLIAVVLNVIALIIYPVKFNELIFEGDYDYTWAYGFGWGATIVMLGCCIIFLCFKKYEDKLLGTEKPEMICQF